MSRIFLFGWQRIAAIALAACLSTVAQAALPVQHWVHASGAKVYLIESPGIPMVDVQIDFDAGSRRDPGDKVGLSGVTAGMASKGVEADGVLSALDENALSEAWADLGASFGASSGNDRMSFQLRSVTLDDLLPRAVHLAARQLGQPAFPADIWRRERERLAASIRESNTRPATVAARTFNTAVYGKHPYGFETTEASLAPITVDDMRQLYRSLIVPCRAKVSIVGAVSRAQAEQLISTLLSKLPATRSSACEALPAVPEVAALTEPNELRLPFDSAQAQVLLGQPGIRRNDPDFFAVTVGNYILGGGGFVSRLNEEVRQKRGLSYSVYSYFSPGLHAGAFAVGLQTRPDQAAQAIGVVREVVQKFVQDGPTAAELDAAKANLVGGYALLIDSNRKLLANLASIAWNELPLDYLDNWTRRVEAVSLEAVRTAFARHLQPERMVTVLVGARDPSN
ncbi:MAG: pitrilysin family protein [Burkholderiaceae bacterium]